MDVGDAATRQALRAMAVDRFGDGSEPDKQNKPAGGEPQGAAATAFYSQLLERLEQGQPLAADDLARLAAQRAAAILSVLGESGVDATRVAATAVEKVDSPPGKPVPVKLGLANR